MKGHTAAATLEAGRRPGPSKWMQTRARRASTTRTREDSMGAKSEAMATQFEAKAKEAAAVLGKLTDADWKKTTTGEQWTVGQRRTIWPGRTRRWPGSSRGWHP